MKLIVNHYFDSYHVSLDTVKEFEKYILKDLKMEKNFFFSKFIAKLTHKTWLFFKKNNWNFLFLSNIFKKNNNKHCFSVLMGPNFSRCLPYFFFASQKNIYMFDAWPQQHHLIKEFADNFNISSIFFSSSQAAETMQGMLKQTKCYWIPEGIDPTQYRFNSYDTKDIDVLSLGRKYDLYHEQIIDALLADGKKYLFEKIKGEIIFASREEFIDGLARAKISVCVPSSITHPDRSGDIETMTVRYLQSMVSKCLIVGHAPKEMIRLFGYNPVIEIDEQNPVGQLRFILDNFNDFIPLIEKNYIISKEKHNWGERWAQILQLISI